MERFAYLSIPFRLFGRRDPKTQMSMLGFRHLCHTAGEPRGTAETPAANMRPGRTGTAEVEGRRHTVSMSGTLAPRPHQWHGANNDRGSAGRGR